MEHIRASISRLNLKRETSNHGDNEGKIIAFTGITFIEEERRQQVKRCPTCNWELDSPTVHGWVRDPEQPWGRSLHVDGIQSPPLPCPTCSPAARLARKRAKLAQAFSGANIPQRHQTWSFETFPDQGDQLAKQYMQRFAQKKGQQGAYLSGPRGHGKTGLAISAAQEFLQRGEAVFYIEASELLSLIRREEYGGEEALKPDRLVGGVEVRTLDLAKQVDLLVNDELNTELDKPTAFVSRTLLSILNHRRNSIGLFTIITSNQGVTEFADSFGKDSIGYILAERVAEDFKILPVNGEKLRKSALDLYRKK